MITAAEQALATDSVERDSCLRGEAKIAWNREPLKRSVRRFVA